jgi:AsmA family/AsmA-like C-terminal region
LRNFNRMSRVRTYGKWIVAVVVVLLLAQSASPFLFRSPRMRAYVLGHLEKSFGRPVEARGFSMNILPFPQMEVDGVSIGEDPAFGREYFLRADRMTAGVHWLGLLRGHFDFGTISLSRPSLILVRNAQGRWNLEGWLPPAAQSTATAAYGPQRAAEPSNHLEKIEFDDGRINFKTGDEKRPFAFTGVSGSVQQMGPGRWQLRLEAQPWRSGVPLQSTGTLQVRGQVAGTSARLQPAEIQLHWDNASIADLFRMITGNDSGVRGEFAVDASASIGKPESGAPPRPGSWKFFIHARAMRIHRWDLTERSDNPTLSLNLNGVWDVLAGEAHADTAVLDLPHSQFVGTASLKTAGMSEWNLRVNNSGIEAQDILEWYRAFQPDVAESVSAKQFFKARFALHGRPLLWEDAELSSDGGELSLPGFAKPLRIGPVQGSTSKNQFQLLPVLVSFEGAEKGATAAAKLAKAKTSIGNASVSQNELELRFLQDFPGHRRTLWLSGKVNDIAMVFKAASAFGKTLNHGWELSGGASGAFQREWSADVQSSRWGGALTLTSAQLQAAGLNLPLKLQDVRAAWNAGGRSVNIQRADAFGASWSGTANELRAPDGSSAPVWNFQLHADHLDARDLDLWFGPRARPNWLRRLLASLLAKSDSNAKPSELLRRISAEGDLTADSITIEKVKLAHPRAHVLFHDLHLDVKDASAEWAGGTVRGHVAAVFSLPPKYEISAEVDRADLAQFPWSAHWADRWNATASGKFRVTTSGVGRDALIAQLAGTGEIQLKSPELRGWDVAASLDAGAPHTGVSRWTSGAGDFTIADRSVQFDALELSNLHEKMRLSGSVHFSQGLDLTFTSIPTDKHSLKVVAPRLFELHGPLETPVATVQTAPAAQAIKQQ